MEYRKHFLFLYLDNNLNILYDIKNEQNVNKKTVEKALRIVSSSTWTTMT